MLILIAGHLHYVLFYQQVILLCRAEAFGSSAFASDDMMSVVDPECRVIGVDGLRVADSSIFPRVTNGNLNAPSIMTGEKASDHILGRTPLAPSNQEPWINPRWQASDR